MNPWYLVVVLWLIVGVLAGTWWAERPRDEWDALARRDRKAHR